MAVDAFGIGLAPKVFPKLDRRSPRAHTMATNNKPVLVSFERLEACIARAFIAVGMPQPDARKVATLMANADMQGSDGHGVIRLVPYVKRIRAGGINLRPNMRVVHERPGSAVLDGDNGMGHLVVSRAVELAIEKARSSGVAWVGARYSNHAGPASLYARMPIEHDMIGLYFAVGNANHLPPWGGAEMLLRGAAPRCCCRPTRSPAASPRCTSHRWCSTWRPPWPRTARSRPRPRRAR
jgi:LDH2 family malate/lactate/ureidoglycolate dehydrogenase